MTALKTWHGFGLRSRTAFGVPDRKTLYITAWKTLFSVPNNIAGLNR